MEEALYKTMTIFTKKLIAAVIPVLMMGSYSASAEELERGNPFLPPASWTEEQARQDERIRVIFREMEPVLKNEIYTRMTETQASMEIKLKRRVDVLSKRVTEANLNRPAAAVVNASSENTATETQPGQPSNFVIPVGSTFISCINKEALYRDNQNNLFKVPKNDPDSISRCNS